MEQDCQWNAGAVSPATKTSWEGERHICVGMPGCSANGRERLASWRCLLGAVASASRVCRTLPCSVRLVTGDVVYFCE